MANSPSVGIDRNSGGTVIGWPHVLQSINDIFTTRFGERIIREWFGSAIPNLLGQQMTPREIVPYFAAMCTAIEMWEPRYRITKIDVLEVTRTGRLLLYIDGVYRPRAAFGDFTADGPRRVSLDFDREGLTRLEDLT